MSSLLFCDNGHHPFSAREVGSQNITASTVKRDDHGNLTSVQERYDLCAAHALGAPAEVPTYQSQVESKAKVVDALTAGEKTGWDVIVDNDNDKWTWSASMGVYECGPLMLKNAEAIEKHYGVKDKYFLDMNGERV